MAEKRGDETIIKGADGKDVIAVCENCHARLITAFTQCNLGGLPSKTAANNGPANTITRINTEDGTKITFSPEDAAVPDIVRDVLGKEVFIEKPDGSSVKHTPSVMITNKTFTKGVSFGVEENIPVSRGSDTIN